MKAILYIVTGLTFFVLCVDSIKMSKGPVKFEANLICRKCRFVQVQEITSLAKARCSRCGGQMAFLFKCDECQYEFPHIPKPEALLRAMPGNYSANKRLEQRCPNCGSEQTHEASPRKANQE